MDPFIGVPSSDRNNAMGVFVKLCLLQKDSFIAVITSPTNKVGDTWDKGCHGFYDVRYVEIDEIKVSVIDG